MRHRTRGRILGRKAPHRRAMFRNMAASLIRTLRSEEDDVGKPKVAGRIVTTVAKAKELRPVIEKLITLAKRALLHEADAAQYKTAAPKNSSEWKDWRKSDRWKSWVKTVSPAVSFRRRAFAALRDKQAVTILFDELAKRFQDRPGGYTRIVKLAGARLGDAGPRAMIEFVGVHDRTRQRKKAKKARQMPVAAPAPAAAPVSEPAAPPAESSTPPAGT